MTGGMNHQKSELSLEVGQFTGSCELSYDITQKIHRSSSGSHASRMVGGRMKMERKLGERVTA